MDKQQLAIDKVKNGDNLFLTGGAGRGKSWVINQINDPTTVLVAPTGIAALNIQGTTAHKAFGLPIGLPSLSDEFNISERFRNLFDRNSPVRRIIIDEVGILRTDMFDLINAKLKRVRNSNEPFGGLQVVVVGDFYQLEPVVSNQEKTYFQENYDSHFCFTSNAWDFKSVVLDKAYRQTQKRQVALLDSIRCKDKHYKRALDIIQNEAREYDDSPDHLHLCCYKKDAFGYNSRFFQFIDSKVYTYHATIEGNDQWKDAVVEKELKLKLGARVLIKANCPEGTYANGETGEVVYLDNFFIRVKKDNGQEVQVTKNKWEKYEYSASGDSLNKNVTSSFEQFPLTLGWAATVHSTQGLTLDNVVLDVGKGCFSHGQLYMALSRVRDLKNLAIVHPLRYSDVICRKEVVNFYRNLE